MSFTISITGTAPDEATELYIRDTVLPFVQAAIPDAVGSFQGDSGSMTYPAQGCTGGTDVAITDGPLFKAQQDLAAANDQLATVQSN